MHSLSSSAMLIVAKTYPQGPMANARNVAKFGQMSQIYMLAVSEGQQIKPSFEGKAMVYLE